RPQADARFDTPQDQPDHRCSSFHLTPGRWPSPPWFGEEGDGPTLRGPQVAFTFSVLRALSAVSTPRSALLHGAVQRGRGGHAGRISFTRVATQVATFTGTALPTWRRRSAASPLRTWWSGMPWARAFSSMVSDRYSTSSTFRESVGRAR